MRKLKIIFGLIFCLSFISGCNNVTSKKEAKSVPDDAINLKLMIGTDKQWVFDEVQKILDLKKIKINNKRIYLTTEKAGSGEAMDKILQSEADYVGWMPASSTHIHWANDLWRKKGNEEQIVDDKYITVFLSPTVIAMKESLAKIMGYPQKKIGWSDILKLSVSPEGWGLYGSPELNPVHTHLN